MKSNPSMPFHKATMSYPRLLILMVRYHDLDLTVITEYVNDFKSSSPRAIPTRLDELDRLSYSTSFRIARKF